MKSAKSVVKRIPAVRSQRFVRFVRFVFRKKKKGLAYEEFKILGCAVEGYSSSHHGGSHRTDDHVMYGPRSALMPPPNPLLKEGTNKKPSSYI